MKQLKTPGVILFCLLAVITFSSFKSQQQLLPTKLRVVVIDGTGNFVESAQVTLFSNEEDYINNTNPLVSMETDEKGKAVFKKLDAVAYYLDVRKGEQNNDGRGSKTDKLREGRTNKVNVVIE